MINVWSNLGLGKLSRIPTFALLGPRHVGKIIIALDQPAVRGSWEGFDIENILSVAPIGPQPYYYGTLRVQKLISFWNFPVLKNGQLRYNEVLRLR